jgi:hypothetical protein
MRGKSWRRAARHRPAALVPVVCALLLAPFLASTMATGVQPAGLQVTQVARLGGSYQVVHELHKTGSFMWLAESPVGSDADNEEVELSRAPTLFRWRAGSSEGETAESLPGGFDSVEAMTGDESTVWLSSSLGQIYRLRNASDPGARFELVLDVSKELGGRPTKVKCLFWDGGRLWVGTQDGGVYSWSEGSSLRLDLRLDGQAIKALHARGGFLWVGSYGGLYRWKPGEDRPQRFWDKRIRAVWETDEMVWVGLDHGGLHRLEKTAGWDASPAVPTKVNFTSDPAERNDAEDVRALYGDGSALWVGTGRGLYRIGGAGTPWTPDIKFYNELSEAQGRVLLEWGIEDYGGRTTPELVRQEVYVNGRRECEGDGISLNRQTGRFNCSFDNPRAAGGMVVRVVATDLNGKHREKEQRAAPAGGLLSTFGAFAAWYVRNSKESWWFAPFTLLGSILSAYLTGVGALLFKATYLGGTIPGDPVWFSPAWLVSRATQLLQVAPGLGRRALFLGYGRRLRGLPAVRQAEKDYFGLPMAVDGKVQPYDATGCAQHERICDELGPQRPVLVVGKGGAGKSTLLARLTLEALDGRLPARFKGFIPLHVPAYYYKTDLAQAVADVLLKRDGVTVTREIIDAQLQTGPFLILFDGLSEVAGVEDKEGAVSGVLSAATSAEYSTCRFILATRPIRDEADAAAVVELHPLTRDVLLTLREHYRLDASQVERVIRQLHSFGDKPLEPLLFTMAVTESEGEQVSATRAELYVRYLKRLLKLRRNEPLVWEAWQDALGHVAGWSLLETGRRGVGLEHEDLIDHISRKVKRKEGFEENLVEMLQRLYNFPAKTPLELVNKLSSENLLQLERQWRFSHDTFEEFFAASRLLKVFRRSTQWPDLPNWRGKEADFYEVIDFVREMADRNELQAILASDAPGEWKERLSSTRPDISSAGEQASNRQ